MFIVSFLAVLGLAAAQEEVEFAGTEEPALFEEVETHLQAELGGVFATGNVSWYTVNGAIVSDHVWSRNKIGGALTGNLGRAIADADADGRLNAAERTVGMAENVRRVDLQARYDRFVGVKDSLYVLAGALIDPFAGYDLRSHEQLGYSRKLVATETTTLTGEVGLDLAQENFVDGVDPGRADVLSGRVMMGFEHAFSESVAFSEQVEVYENLLVPADVRVLNTAALSSKLSNTLSTRLSHTLTFDNVPVEGFRPLDQTTMFTLVASIL